MAYDYRYYDEWLTMRDGVRWPTEQCGYAWADAWKTKDESEDDVSPECEACGDANPKFSIPYGNKTIDVCERCYAAWEMEG